MGRPELAPDQNTLRRYAAEKLTYAAAADRYAEDSGIRVSPSTIKVAVQRHGVEWARTRPRYKNQIPWKVCQDHRAHNDVRMLRLRARRAAGLPLSAQAARTLAGWEKDLAAHDAVVHYDRDTVEGFHWVHREPQDDPDSVIRRPA